MLLYLFGAFKMKFKKKSQTGARLLLGIGIVLLMCYLGGLFNIDS